MVDVLRAASEHDSASQDEPEDYTIETLLPQNSEQVRRRYASLLTKRLFDDVLQTTLGEFLFPETAEERFVTTRDFNSFFRNAVSTTLTERRKISAGVSPSLESWNRVSQIRMSSLVGSPSTPLPSITSWGNHECTLSMMFSIL